MNSELPPTICAPATAPGGALAIIRISGPAAISIACSVCCCITATTPANTIHHTPIIAPPPCDAVSPHQAASSPCDAVSPHQEILDDALVSIFRAPHSYTGEDCVEISCHGSRYIVRRILDILVQQGCRMAAPGEFTKRAYLNGKLDLSQAEAVADLIASTNEATHRLAMSQLRGGISTELALLRDHLLRLTSLLELELDFSDHEDLEFADRTELLQLAQTIEAHIARLARSFETGQALKQGIPVAIVGKTNVGKSTLLNRLLHDDRAIVSDVHGTTRDTIEDTIDIRGVTFRFIDTAGIRQTTDQVEQIGIQRTYAAIQKARIVLWLLDAAPTEAEVADMTARTSDKALLPIVNKADTLPSTTVPYADTLPSATVPYADALPSATVPYADTLPSATVPYADALPSATVPSAAVLQQPPLLISAKTGQGLDALEAAIFSAANLPTLSDTDVIVTNARHYDALQRAHASILRVLDGMGAAMVNGQWSIVTESLSGDLLSEDLRQTLDILAEITGGHITPQETLNNIFSHFCVGK